MAFFQTNILLVLVLIGVIGLSWFFISSMTRQGILNIIDIYCSQYPSQMIIIANYVGNELSLKDLFLVYIDKISGDKERLLAIDSNVRIFVGDICNRNTIGKRGCNITLDNVGVISSSQSIGMRIVKSFLAGREYEVIPFVFGRQSFKISVRCIERSEETYFPISFDYRNITLVAFSSPHWVVIDYYFGKYMIFQSVDNDFIAERGPAFGEIPIYTNRNNFVIQLSSSSWQARPIDSPIIIFKNPNITTIWIFNWTDPWGSHLFRVYPFDGAIDDMLIFWEDLFNPFNPPPSLDDWKDHVLRLTVLENNKYRIAVYLAKGGYKHQFYAFTKSSNPLEGELVYEKPHRVTLRNYVNNYYDEVYWYIVDLE